MTVCCAVLAVGFTAARAEAETIVGSSLEWLTCASDVVVVGKIEKIETTRGPGDVLYDDCTVQVSEVLAGKPRDRVVFCLRLLSAESPARAWMKSREGLLLFLSPATNNGPEKRLDGMLVPTSSQFPLAIVDLSAPQALFDMRFNRVAGRAAILDAVRKSAKALEEHRKAKPNAAIRPATVEAPIGSEAWKALYAGSAVCLAIPDFLAGDRK
jgi:hypothetical protein